MPILWACCARNGVLLAEAGSVHAAAGAVGKLATTIVAKKPTAGWEFASLSGLKAIKLHLHESRELCWSVCCIHDAHDSQDAAHAKGFLEKLLLMTEPMRETEEWRSGGPRAGMGFAPTLQQRMEQANSMGRLAMVTDKVNEVKGIMGDNIALLLENQDRVVELENKSADLMQQASVFKKASSSVRKFYMWQNAKFGATVGTAVTAGVAVIAVPPLAAAMGPGAGVGVGLGIAATAGAGVGVATGYVKNEKDAEQRAGAQQPGASR